MFKWTAHITVSALMAISLSGYAQADGPISPKIPNDQFTKTFLSIYKDAPQSFINVRGKKIKSGQEGFFECKKYLPGTLGGYIDNAENPTCLFDFGTFNSMDDAQAAMQQITSKVSDALAKKIIVRYLDSIGDPAVKKRTAIAELEDGGFRSFNINVDVVRKGSEENETFGVELSIATCKGPLYRIIWNKEPYRSSNFNKTFRTIYAQFYSDATTYYCNEQLPGFTCNQYDSAGKDQLMMLKISSEFRDARVEFESLTTNLRAMLGDKYLYYIAEPAGEVLMQVVFISAEDFDKPSRKSISSSILQRSQNEYAIRLIMYHP